MWYIVLELLSVVSIQCNNPNINENKTGSPGEGNSFAIKGVTCDNGVIFKGCKVMCIFMSCYAYAMSTRNISI